MIENCASLVEKLFYWAERKPEATFLRFTGSDGSTGEYSWAEVVEQVKKIAAALKDFGLDAGDRIAILGANSPHWLMADLAIQLSGCVSVPIYTSMSLEGVQRVVEMCQPKALMLGAAANWTTVSPAFGPRCRIIALSGADASDVDADWDGLLNTYQPLESYRFPGLDDRYTVLQTSGSTGLPKGVVQTFRCSAVSSRDFASQYECDEESRFISYLPLAHAGERTLILGSCLYSGGTLHFAGPPETFIKDLQVAKPTFFLAVPRIWEKLRQAALTEFGNAFIEGAESDIGPDVIDFLGLGELDTGITGGAPMPPELNQWYARVGLQIFEIYASSEIASAIVSTRAHHRARSVGRALPHVSIKIADNDEILIKSDATMLEYYGEPEKTWETLVDDWVHTGDMGRLDEDGYLYITGRVKDIYKTAKGKYVAPLPIERLFAGNPLLEQVCLVGEGLPQPVLVAQTSEGIQSISRAEAESRLTEVLAAANGSLQAHEKIKFIILTSVVWNEDNGLCTHSLKIKRPNVEKTYQQLIAKLYPEAEKQGWKVYWQS